MKFSTYQVITGKTFTFGGIDEQLYFYWVSIT